MYSNPVSLEYRDHPQQCNCYIGNCCHLGDTYFEQTTALTSNDLTTDLIDPFDLDFNLNFL